MPFAYPKKYNWTSSFFSLMEVLEVNHFSLFSHNENTGIQTKGTNVSLICLEFKGLWKEVLYFLG